MVHATKRAIGDYGAFLEKVNDGLSSMGIDTSDLKLCDHICYRVETELRYHEISQLMGRSAAMIGEVEVGGRMISTFEFEDPLPVAGWEVPCIELPMPKEGSPYSEGLEHAEFVVSNLEKFQHKYRGLPFDTKALGKSINPELGLKLPGVGFGVKFHEIALGAVVRLEKRLGS